MAAITTKVPEEESLIGEEDPEVLALAQEDDSIHAWGTAGDSTSSRSWRYGLCAVGILCAVVLFARAREPTPEAPLLKTKDVDGITVLQGGYPPVAPTASMWTTMTNKAEGVYDDAKLSMMHMVPKWMGGTLGETTTTIPPYGVIPYGAAPYNGTTLYPGQMPLAPYPGTTIMPDGKAYALPAQVPMAPAPVDTSISAAPLPPLSKSAATTQPPVSVTQEPPSSNQTAAVGASVSTVQKDNHVTSQDLSQQAATNPYGVQPCPDSGVTAAGTPCTPLKTYPYPADYAGYTTTAAPPATQAAR